MVRMSSRTLVIIGMVLVALVAGGTGAWAGMQVNDDEASGSTTPSTSQQNGNELPALVEQVRDSVVSVVTIAPGAPLPSQPIGSGFFVDDAGHVLTNFHVASAAPDALAVQLSDGTIAPAEMLGVDPGNDLAVLRIEVGDELIQPVTFGDSDSLTVGEGVFAIGSPFGLAFTVTSGIVSALDRDELVTPGQRVISAIQTDAAVNPGNSGGPLFNMAGEVIGVTTAIRSASGNEPVFTGIALAVPISTAQRHLEALIAGETVRHPQLGIGGIGLTPHLAEALELSVDAGVYVLTVAPGGGAERAGVQVPTAPSPQGALPAGGDVIVSLGGDEVTDLSELRELLDQYEPGDTVALGVVRGEEELELEVILDEWAPPRSPTFP